LITRITFGDEYRSLSSSLCSLLHFPVASSLLGPNITTFLLLSLILSYRFTSPRDNLNPTHCGASMP
jgi:hypothetical protein